MKTIVEILIDYSNSMGPCDKWKDREQYLLPDGSTRMSLAKKILVNDIIPILDGASKVNIIAFYSSNAVDTPTVLEEKSLYDAAYDSENLIDVINKLPDPVETGGTPITSSLANAIDRLKSFSDWDRKIILVTDGQETEKSDYKESVKEAMKLHEIPCSVFVIGLTQDPEAEAKSKALADDTNGGYINLKTTKIDSDSISSKLAPLKIKVLQQQSENIIIQTRSQNITPRTVIAKTVASHSVIEESKNTEQSDGLASQTEQLPEDTTAPSIEATTEDRLNHDVVDSNANELLVHEVLSKIDANTQVLSSLGKQVQIIQAEISKVASAHEINDGEVISLIENKDEQDRVGRKAEKLVFEVLEEKYGKRLLWANKDDESGKPFDYQVVDGEEIELYIDCKATKSTGLNFYMTDKEWKFFLHHTKNYQVYFVSNLDSDDRSIHKIDNLMDWLVNGKVVPFSSENRAIKANRVLLSIQK